METRGPVHWETGSLTAFTLAWTTTSESLNHTRVFLISPQFAKDALR